MRLGSLLLILILAGGCAGRPATAGPPIRYTVALDAPQTQTIDLSMTVDGVRGETLDVALPVWRPGRYSILDPAGTVRDVRASDEGGATLPVRKVEKSAWRVTTNGATRVRVDYRLYANSIADRTRHVDDSHAFLSGSAVFLYVPDRRGDEVTVSIDAPAGWRVATGLEPAGDDPRRLTAPSYDVLVDSPIEIGLHDRHVFEVRGKPHEIVIWPTGVEHDAERLKNDFAKIVETQASIFDVLPYERYVFLIHAGAGGGGTEHLNSTIMQTSRAAIEGSIDESRSYERFLGLVAHEFFHTWNVKQLRPAGIHPYDYQRENYTDLLWVAEGTTSYYDDLSLVRAGLVKPKKYLDQRADAVTRQRRRPGAGVQSLAESSFDAWIKHNAPTPDSANSTVSFYSKGALVSLLLDMEIRGRTANATSLDDVMRVMFERFPLSGPGYTSADLVEVVEELAGSDFDTFFANYVDGTEPLPLEDALRVVGLELYFKAAKRDDEDAGDAEDSEDSGDLEAPDDTDEPDDADEPDAVEDVPPPASPKLKPYLGMNLRDSGGRARVSSVLSDGPAFHAGVIAGDEVVALNGRELRASDLGRRIERMSAGDAVTLHLFRRGELRAITVTLDARLDGKWAVRRLEDASGSQQAAYASWLGQPW